MKNELIFCTSENSLFGCVKRGFHMSADDRKLKFKFKFYCALFRGWYDIDRVQGKRTPNKKGKNLHRKRISKDKTDEQKQMFPYHCKLSQRNVLTFISVRENYQEYCTVCGQCTASVNRDCKILNEQSVAAIQDGSIFRMQFCYHGFCLRNFRRYLEFELVWWKIKIPAEVKFIL